MSFAAFVPVYETRSRLYLRTYVRRLPIPRSSPSVIIWTAIMSRETDELDDTGGRHLQQMLAAIRNGSSGGLGLPRLGSVNDTQPVDEPPVDQPGQWVVPQSGMVIRDTWELAELVGKGAFGLVFTARHKTLGREDAIKFLHPHLADDRELRERFEQEAMVMARLRGDHLVYVHDCGEHEGLPYFAMERLEGKTLDECLEGEQPLPLAEFYRLAEGLLRGLAEIHAHGIVHRDVKPANVFVLRDSGRVKVLDFGLAMTSMRVTAKGVILGTPLYMAPELLLSPDVEASVATDIYSAGIVLYQMLTGRVPFLPRKDGNLADFLQQVITTVPRAPSADRPEIPDEVDEWVLRCIDKDPAQRPETADEIVDALERIRAASRPLSEASEGTTGPKQSTTAVTADQDSAPSTQQARARRTRPLHRRATVVGGASLVLAVVLLLLGYRWPLGPPPAFSEAGGIVVTAPAWAGGDVERRYETLCSALRNVDLRRVQCVRVSRFNADPGRYRSWVLEGDAAMAIHVSDSEVASVVWDESLAQLPLFEVLPSLELRDASRVEHLAPLLAVLPRTGTASAIEVPPVDVERVGYKWATVGALLRRLHADDTTEDSTVELRALSRCKGARDDSEEDRRLCDIARYLAASHDLSRPETCARIEPALERLAKDRWWVLATLGGLSLAHCLAPTEPARAASLALEVLDLYPGEGSCHLVRAIPLIPLMVSGSDAERTLAQRVQQFEPAECAGAADAIARRGVTYRAQQRWSRAAEDFYSAFRIETTNRIYLIAWAEARLMTPLDEQSRRRLRAELRRDLFSDPVPSQQLPLAITVIYLRWLVTRDRVDAAELMALYQALPRGARPLPEGACEDLRPLACPEEVSRCTLDVLEVPKGTMQDAERELELGLGLEA